MSEHGEIRYGNSLIPFTVTRSRRRKKTIAITLDATDGVLVAAPVQASLDQLRAVVTSRAGWILQHGHRDGVAPRPKSFISGETLPYLGREVRMEVIRADVVSVGIRFSHWKFEVTVPARLEGEERRLAVRAAFIRWYRRRARERLRTSVTRWGARGLTTPEKVIVRDQKQRWGSCAPDGTIRFNWRIAMADQLLADYVVVHELVHLSHRNHSRKFWAALEDAMPDYLLRRARLKEVGPGLSL